jgi:hypothetical protein
LADHKDWNNVYFAIGFDPKAARYIPKSCDLRTVLTRLKEIHPSFFTSELEAFALRHTVARNAELHSGETAFDIARTSEWLPMFYLTCLNLLKSMDEDLGVLFGEEEAETASTLARAATDEAAKAIGKTIQAHKTVWEGKTEDQQREARERGTAWATRQEGHRANCPACGTTGLLTGSPAAAAQKTLDGDLIVEKQSYLPARFECVACGLKISGYSQLNACGLGDLYTGTFTYDAAEYYAPAPEDFYEPDYNEY